MRGNYRGLGLYTWTYPVDELEFSAIRENHVRKNVLSYNNRFVEHSICAAEFTDIVKFTDWYEVCMHNIF